MKILLADVNGHIRKPLRYGLSKDESVYLRLFDRNVPSKMDPDTLHNGVAGNIFDLESLSDAQ